MNRKSIETALLATAFAALAAIPALGAAGTDDLSKKVDEAVGAIEHAAADQKDEATRRAKLALDGVSEQIKQLEDRINGEWGDMNQFARQSAGASLNKLHDQRDQLSRNYHDLAQSSASRWEGAKQSFLETYNALHRTLLDAELNL